MAAEDIFDVRPVGDAPGEIDRVCDLFRESMPQGPLWRTDYLRWLYFDNPAGAIIGANAWDGEQLAAHYVVMPLRASVDGRPVAAALSLNTATHPSYQRRGLFVRLAEATYDMAREQGVHHVVGVANANSTPGFVRKLGFQHVAALDAVLSLGTPSLTPHAGAGPASWQRLWTAEDLAWRLGNPALPYRARRLSGGRVAVLAPTGRLGIQAVLRIEDDPALAGVVQDVLAPSRSTAPRLWIGLSRSLRRPLIQRDVPERFRASPLNLIFRPLQEPGDVLDASGVEFQAIDFDAY